MYYLKNWGLLLRRVEVLQRPTMTIRTKKTTTGDKKPDTKNPLPQKVSGGAS